MSALTIYNPNKSKITATSSAITLKGKKKNIVLSKKEEKSGALAKISGGESSLITNKGGALVKMSGKESSLVTKSKLVSGDKDKNSLKEKLLENNKKIISITKTINKKNNVKIKSTNTDIKALKAEEPAKQKEETEKVLEDRPEEKEAKKKGPAIPIPKKPSLFDRLFQYLALTGLNWVVGKLSNQKLGLAGFFNNLQSVIENIVEWFPKFLDGTFAVVEAIGPFVVGTGQFLFDVFVGALDLAYGAYDGIRQTIGNLFGEEARDQFDNFATKINEFLAISGAIGTALLLSSKVLLGSKGIFGRRGGPGPGRGGGGGGGGAPSGGRIGARPVAGNNGVAEYMNRNRATKLIERRYGNEAARAYENSYKNALQSGKTPTQAAVRAKADINKLFKTGKIIPQAAGKGLGIGGGSGASGPFGGVFRRGLGKAGSRLQTRIMGRGARLATRRVGAKAGEALGKIGSKLKIPVIGSIISIVMSLMNGDPIQKALFKGIGTAIGGIIGGAITGAGTFFTAGVGAFLAPFVMGISAAFGDFVGDLLYTLFYDGGPGAAAKKLGDAIKGLVTGTGDVLKGIFNWVFNGGLLNLLKTVGGGLAKFALYLLNPGGLLWDILKAGGSALKAITGFIFGGGLFDLIKNIGGGLFKFITYILNPGGLLSDALKQGGKIVKKIFDFAINAIGSATQFIKDFIRGVFSRFVENFPTIKIPEGWGVQTTLGKLLGWIPFLKPYMEGGKLTAFPDLTMFVPGIGVPFFVGHMGKSMFPGSFFENMPSGLGEAWKGAKDKVEETLEEITENIKNTTAKAVEGTKRAAGGIADALTFNLFDFDKQNEVEEYNDGGSIKIGAQDFRDLAYIVSGEAARGTNDEYGVSAAVLNRVASPVWPSTVKQVGSQSGQFEAVYTGKAKDEPELAEKLASPKGQASIASAMRLLEGRTDFKGQSMLANKGSTDIMFHPRGNFFHYTSQRGKNDPVPANPNQSWKRLIGSGGPKIDLKTTTSSAQSMGTGEGSGEQKDGAGTNSILDSPLMKLFNQLNIGGSGNSSAVSTNNADAPKSSSIGSIGDDRDKKTKTKSGGAGGGISSIGSSSKPSSPAQISSSPSSSLSSTKTNITKASQSLSYEKPKPNTRISVIIKEKTTQVIT